MVFAVKQTLFVTLNRRHFLIGSSFDTGFDSTLTDTKEEIVGPSTSFLVGHGISILAASCGDGIEGLTVGRRRVCVERDANVLFVYLRQFGGETYRLVKVCFRRRITEGKFAEFVNPGHTFLTRFFITLVVIEREIVLIVRMVGFFGLRDGNRDFYHRFKFVTRRVFYTVNELVITCGDTNVFHFAEILPACKQRRCRFAALLFIEFCGNEVGNVHVAGLVDCRCARQFNVRTCDAGNTVFNTKPVYRRFVNYERTRFVVGNR